jgi:hypothetical protein
VASRNGSRYFLNGAIAPCGRNDLRETVDGSLPRGISQREVRRLMPSCPDEVNERVPVVLILAGHGIVNDDDAHQLVFRKESWYL